MIKLPALGAGLLAATALLGTPAHAAGMLTAANGMTLYIFDKDAGGAPTCYDACAKNWPPYLGKAGETRPEGWKLVPRKDGAMQWSYDGKPLYFYVGDKKKGDMAGNGRGDLWHVVND